MWPSRKLILVDLKHEQFGPESEFKERSPSDFKGVVLVEEKDSDPRRRDDDNTALEFCTSGGKRLELKKAKKMINGFEIKAVVYITSSTYWRTILSQNKIAEKSEEELTELNFEKIIGEYRSLKYAVIEDS
ncbi:hypothetical protein NPIL_6921 [Nephila pilipes]|uniref:Uncharacterized protein n=1 Tax=Nephila pilipes TaxID=299642 RepID=A0A8X6Q9X0_NEPPI|nr:hypothetical protein NPIL_6921 [Nephila pilipes]